MSNQEILESIVKTFTKDCEKNIGLTASVVSIASDNPERAREADMEGVKFQTLIEAGEVDFALFIDFEVAEWAFSDAVINPDQVKIDKQFNLMVPDDFETFQKNGLDGLVEGFDE